MLRNVCVLYHLLLLAPLYTFSTKECRKKSHDPICAVVEERICRDKIRICVYDVQPNGENHLALTLRHRHSISGREREVGWWWHKLQVWWFFEDARSRRVYAAQCEIFRPKPFSI